MSKIVFITGPSGSGKSATATRVAEIWPRACVLLKFDEIRTFIKSGYAEPANGWDSATEQQWTITKKVVIAMAKAYVANEIDVVIEAFANPGDYVTWQALFTNVAPYQTFALLPTVDVALARNGMRSGAAKLKEHDIRQNHEWSLGWQDVEGVTVFDNSDIDVGSLTDKIIRASQH